MYVCINLCMYIHRSIDRGIDVSVYLHLCLYAYMSICMPIYHVTSVAACSWLCLSVVIHIRLYIFIYIQSPPSPPASRAAGWPLQDSVLLRGFCSRINHPFIAPPTCAARTIAILLQGHCAIYDAPPTPLLYALHYTKLAMAISCKGQIAACFSRSRATRSPPTMLTNR